MARERLQYWSTQKLDDSNRKIVTDVEQHGVHVIHVMGSDSQGWSYSVGLVDSYGHPEVIIVGMDHETAQAAINELAKRVKGGARFTDGERVTGVISDDLVMRTVDERWKDHLVGRAQWFMADKAVPLLQAVYPDDANKFAWEEGFDDEWRAAQPLLFAHDLDADVEAEFLEEQELLVEENADWPFPIPGDKKVFTTTAIAEGSDLIASVMRDAEDDWQFHGFEEASDEEVEAVALRYLVRLDPSLKEIAELPERHVAKRDSIMDPWVIEADEE
jgi:hypothetical protein